MEVAELARWEGESTGVCFHLQPGSLPHGSGSVKWAFALSVTPSKAAFKT